MRETGLLHETNPSPSSPRLEVSFYDDCESFLSLEPTFVIDSHVTNLEEVIDPPLIFVPLVASSLSSTLRDTTEGVLCFLSCPFPVAQCMGLEMGKSLGVMLAVLKMIRLISRAILYC